MDKGRGCEGWNRYVNPSTMREIKPFFGSPWLAWPHKSRKEERKQGCIRVAQYASLIEVKAGHPRDRAEGKVYVFAHGISQVVTRTTRWLKPKKKKIEMQKGESGDVGTGTPILQRLRLMMPPKEFPGPLFRVPKKE
jgi:hypothetical protein